jgi:hypothetical protein
MTERSLKYRAGVFLIVAHLVIMLLIIILFFMNGFDAGQFTTLMGVIAPMFSGYTTAIVAFIIKDRHVSADASPKVTNTFSALFFVFPGIFAAVIAASIWFQAYSLVFGNFETFKTVLITIESAFAVYIGMFVYSLFEKHPAAKPSRLSPR